MRREEVDSVNKNDIGDVSIFKSDSCEFLIEQLAQEPHGNLIDGEG